MLEHGVPAQVIPARDGTAGERASDVHVGAKQLKLVCTCASNCGDQIKTGGNESMSVDGISGDAGVAGEGSRHSSLRVSCVMPRRAHIEAPDQEHKFGSGGVERAVQAETEMVRFRHAGHRPTSGWPTPGETLLPKSRPRSGARSVARWGEEGRVSGGKACMPTRFRLEGQMGALWSCSSQQQQCVEERRNGLCLII